MAGLTYPLNGKTVLVTGAARGIGAEAARQIAARGARVALVGLEPEELERAARACGDNALWFEADVTDYSAIEAAVNATVEQTGGLDVVVANAGIGAGGPVRYVDPHMFERVIEVNLLGVFRTIRAALPHVIDRRGYILSVASVAAMLPGIGMSAYCASKAGNEALCRTLRLEVKHLGVDVGVAYFSWIDTDLVRSAAERESFKHMRSKLPRGPLGRTFPVSDTGKAIVHGIERRARDVAVPPSIKALSVLRGVLYPMVERRAQREAPEAMAMYEAEIQRDPSVLGAVGPGGEADARASGVGARGA